MGSLALALASFLADPCLAGRSAFQAGHAAKAESSLSECIAQPKAPVEAFLLLCGMYQSRGDSNRLYRTALEGLRRFPEEKRFYLSAGTIAGRQKRYADAIAVLVPGLKRWPDDEKIRSLLASAYFGQGTALLDAGENAKAAEALKLALELTPRDSEARMNLGRAVHNLARFADALAQFDAVVEIEPKFPLVQFHRGLSLYSLGRFDNAIQACDAERAEYAPAALVRGLSHLARGNAEAARKDLGSAVTAMPGNAAAQYGYARALVRLGRYADAEPVLRQAMQLDASDPGPANTLVTVLHRLGRTDEARSLAQTAAELAREKRTAAPGEIRFEGRAP